jgi:hypothetical protein
MKKIETELKELPDVPVGRFKQTLRRELVAAVPPTPAHGLKAALVATSLATVVFAALAVSFVIAPGVPGRLNAALFQDGAGGEMIGEMAADRGLAESPGAVVATGRTVVPSTSGAAVQPAVLSKLLEQSNAGAQRDRDFVESWYAQQSRPAQVKAVSGERILSIRQFELANGERVAVLTDLGAAPARRTESPAAATTERMF